MNKTTFTFTAVWPKRPRAFRPFTKRGVVSATTVEAAESLLRKLPEFSGVERIAVAALAKDFEVITAG